MKKDKKKNLVIPRQVTIRVTRKNIDTGKFGDTESCAIAKAVKSKLGDHPAVTHDGIDLTLKCGVTATYSIPKKAVEFINRFDAIDEISEAVYSKDGLDYEYEASAKATAKAKAKALKALKPFKFVATLESAEFNA